MNKVNRRDFLRTCAAGAIALSPLNAVTKAASSTRNLEIAPAWCVLYGENSFEYVLGAKLSSLFHDEVSKLIQDGENVRHIAMSNTRGGSNQVITVYRDSNCFTTISDSYVDADFKQIRDQGHRVNDVAIAANGGRVILYGRNGFLAAHTPAKVIEALTELNRRDQAIKQVAYRPNGGWVILYGSNGSWTKDIPDDLKNTLHGLNNAKEEIKSVSFDRNDHWIVIYGKNNIAWSRGAGRELDMLERIKRRGEPISKFTYLY